MDVITAHTRKETMSDKEWYGTGRSFREVFSAASKKEQEEVFEATKSFTWEETKPVPIWRNEAKSGKIEEPVLLRFHTIFCTKNTETFRERVANEDLEKYRAEVLSKLKAKTRTVCGRETWLISGKPTDGRVDGELFVSRTPTVGTQKLNLVLGAGKQKELLQSDETGMYPWAWAKGRFAIGIPPPEYFPDHIVKKWEALGYGRETLACPCPKANYGRVRAGFDACDKSHEDKIETEWVSPVKGLYVREAKGDDVRGPGDPRGPSFGPDSVCSYVDDDICAVKAKTVLSELEEKRGIPRTTVDLRKEQSRILGVTTEVHTFSEEEAGVADARKGETITIVVMSQRDLLQTWVNHWKECGRPMLKSRCETPVPAGTVLMLDKTRTLGEYAEECRHHTGVLRYAVTWTRSTDLGYAGSLLAQYQAHWCVTADQLLIRVVSYVAHTVDVCEYHIVSSRELKAGLTVKTSSDASHAGHKDARGQHCYSVEFRGSAKGGITRIVAVCESKKSKLTATSSAEEELRAAAQATTTTISSIMAYEALMRPIERTIAPQVWHAEERGEGEVREEILNLDAKAAIQRILRGHCETSRHGRIKTAFLAEYWTGPRRGVQHERGQEFLPDLGTKGVCVQRFKMLCALGCLKAEQEQVISK